VEALKEMYGADVSASLISKVTDRVIDQVTKWQGAEYAKAAPPDLRGGRWVINASARPISATHDSV